MHNKLYLVTLCGGSKYSTSYVVAEDETSAYQKVKSYLDTHDICFNQDRVLKSIQLLADARPAGIGKEGFLSSETGTILYV